MAGGRNFKSMEVQAALLCDSAQDYNGKLCLLGSFDTIVTPGLPAVHPHCAIALRIVCRAEDEGDHKLQLSLIDEDGKNILPKIEPNVEVKLPENVFFFSRNLIFNLQQIKFERSGQYSIDITIDGVMMARIPLQVMMSNREA